MTLYSRRTFSKESFQWTKCVVKYLHDSYGYLTLPMVTFLVEVQLFKVFLPYKKIHKFNHWWTGFRLGFGTWTKWHARCCLKHSALPSSLRRLQFVLQCSTSQRRSFTSHCQVHRGNCISCFYPLCCKQFSDGLITPGRTLEGSSKNTEVSRYPFILTCCSPVIRKWPCKWLGLWFQCIFFFWFRVVC